MSDSKMYLEEEPLSLGHAHKSDFTKLFKETRHFIGELETMAPANRLRQSVGVEVVRHDIGHRDTEIMDATSLASVVDEFKVLCLKILERRVHPLKPAINRYMNILNSINLDSINLDSMDEIKLQREITLLRNRFAAAVGGIEVMTEPVVKARRTARGGMMMKMGEALVLGGSIGTVPPITKSTSTPPNEWAGTNPQELALCVSLEGDRVKGRAVEQGANCTLIVDWRVLIDNALMVLTGNALQEARKAKLEVVFMLSSGSFKMEEGSKSYIATRFNDDGFETPVQFNLIAPTISAVNAKLELDIQIHGRPVVRIDVLLAVVQDLNKAPEGGSTKLVKVDIDKLITEKNRPISNALLQIFSTAAPPHANLTITQAYPENFSIKHEGLGQTSIANKLNTIATRMNTVSNDPIWTSIADPLNPTVQEKHGLSELLARTAAAGFEIYDWLAGMGDMEVILSQINKLPDGSRIIVQTDDVAIPWETIYPVRYCFDDAEDEHHVAEVDHTKFWGYRFVFETLLIPGKHDLRKGDVADRIELHRNAEKTLTAVMNKEIDAEAVKNGWAVQEPVEYQRLAFNNACSSMHDKSACVDAKTMLVTEPTPGLFVYFYCHGSAEIPFNSEKETVLKIGEKCWIKLVNVDADFAFTDAPIVFLNSCSSSQGASVSFDSFCAKFQRKEAIGLITTSFAVPATFAARYGCDMILRYMKAQETLGEIIQDMRKLALDQNNPIGLFYMLRGPWDITLKPN